VRGKGSEVRDKRLNAKRKYKGEGEMKKIPFTILSMVFLLTGLVYGADQGKIVVAAEGKTAAAKVSGVAARAPYFLIFDGSGKFLEAIDNPYKTAKGGAGKSVVPLLAQKGATTVVAGEFGKNMIDAMKGRGIQYLEFRGNAEAAVKKALEAKK
jgi:predicted Fe-Mo cluster-binding NifX family protein